MYLDIKMDTSTIDKPNRHSKNSNIGGMGTYLLVVYDRTPVQFTRAVDLLCIDLLGIKGKYSQFLQFIENSLLVKGQAYMFYSKSYKPSSHFFTSLTRLNYSRPAPAVPSAAY